MSYLIDTNIISEVRKGDRCNPNVARWYATIDDSDLYLSVLVLGEIRRGIELARLGDPDKAGVLERWLNAVGDAFQGRILGVDQAVAEEWGRMNVPDPVPTVDGLLAATAKVNGLTLATRNVSESCAHRRECLQSIRTHVMIPKEWKRGGSYEPRRNSQAYPSGWPPRWAYREDAH